MQNKRALLFLLSANAVSGFSQGISMLAIPWYFTKVLNRPDLFGIIYAVVTLISMFWALYAGSLIDKYSRKKIFLLLNLVSGIFLLLISGIGFYLHETPSYLAVSVFFITILNYNIHYPAVYAFGQEISSKENYGKFNSLAEIQGQATSVLSGAIAAILMSGTEHGALNLLGATIRLPFEFSPWTLQEIFLLNACTYFIAVLFVLKIPYTQSYQVKTSEKLLTRIKDGVSFLRKNKAIFVFGNTSLAIFVVLLVQVQMLLPMYVNNHLHQSADVYASSEIYYAFGALFAGFFIRKLFKNTNTINAILSLMIVTVLLFVGCFIFTSVFYFFVFSILMGITNAGSRVLRITYLFHHIPNDIIGRTSSVFQMINTLLRFIVASLFSIPFFSQSNNVIWAYLACALFVLIAIFPLLKQYKNLTKNNTI
ncbi:MAG: MFS transporter [Bacteroidota bacterium]